MKKYIKATIQSLAKEELLKIIPPDTLERIKKTDKKPEFKVYCIGHEGTAKAAELSFGQKINKAFRYMKDMIFRIVDRLQFGTRVFNRHVDTNEHVGREQIGELVGKAIKAIGDKISALAAIYIYPQYRKLPLDVASIEANIEYIPKGKEGGDVIDVDEITGIALSSSEIDEPAFPGATLLGIVQAFAKEGGDKMTKEEILEAIKESKLKVTDLFTKEEILDTEIVKTDHKDAHDHARRIEKQLGEEREKIVTLTKDLETAQGKIKTLNEQASTTQVKTLFETAIGVRKFDDKEKAFIEKNLGTFKSDKSGEELKADFDKFLDNQLKDYGETVKLITGKEPEKKEPESKGTPSADGKDKDTKDLTNPENNEFIPKE